MPSELNGDDRTTLMAGESEVTIVGELVTTHNNNNNNFQRVEALLQLCNATQPAIIDSGSQTQLAGQEDQFNAPDEDSHRRNFVPPSLTKKSAFKFNLAQVLAQNLPDKTIGE